MSRRNLQKAFNKFDRIKKQKEFEVPAVLGFTINGVNTVEVGNRSGFVWARIRNNTNEVVQAFNDEVSPVYGLPVILIRDETDRTRYKVKSKDLGVYQNWNNTPYLPRHGNQHSFNPDAGGGGDVVFVYNRQFMPLAVHPSGSAGGGNVYVQQYGYYQGAQWKYAGGTGTASLLPYKPTGSTARMVLVYLDEAGNPQLSAGSSYFSSSITGNAAILPFVPSLGSQTDIPLAAIRLVSGTNNIVWDNIYDLRPIIVSDGFIPTGTSGHIIQDDGTPLAQQTALNFVGTAFSVYNVGGATNVSGTFVSSGGGGIPERSIPIYEDSVFKITGTVLNFTDNINVVVSGSVAHISAQATGAGLNVLGIFDDSVYKVSGSAISFDSNLTVVSSGTVAFVTSSGGSYPPTWKYDINEPKGSADTPDDDFNTGSLDVKWTAVSGSAGTVNLLRENPVAIYDLSSVSGMLAVQVGHTGTAQTFQMRQDYTLPSGTSIVLAINPGLLLDGGQSNDEIILGLSLNDNDTGYNQGNWISLLYEVDANNAKVAFTGLGGPFTNTFSSFNPSKQFYLRFQRHGATNYVAFMSLDGNNWTPLGAVSLGVSFSNIWIFVRSQASMITTPVNPIPIQQFDWIRQGTSNVRPW